MLFGITDVPILNKAEPRGSPASGLLRSRVQPRGEAARLYASASPRGSPASGSLRCRVQPRGEAARLYASASPGGSPASGLLRSRVQPRGEAARLFASASRPASPGGKGGRQPTLTFSNQVFRPPFSLRCKRIVRRHSSP